MEERHNLDRLPLANVSNEDLKRIKDLEKDLNQKYDDSLYLMALSGEHERQ